MTYFRVYSLSLNRFIGPTGFIFQFELLKGVLLRAMPGKPGCSSTGAVGVKWLAHGHHSVGNEGDRW